MGKIDTPTKKLMNNNVNAADLINYAVYGGKQVVKPNDLVNVDPTMIFMNDKDDGNFSGDDETQRVRDIYKKVALFKSDNKKIYAMVGIENQTNVHYAMPVRCAVYDSLSYLQQIEYYPDGTRRKNFGKNDKILPVVTIVIHFSADKWDGCLSIKELFEETDTDLMPLISDYKMNLVDIARLNDLNSFQSELKQVFGFIKCSKSDTELERLLSDDKSFTEMSPEAAATIKVCTNYDLNINKEGATNVCEAIEQLKRKSHDKGFEEGIEEGTVKGAELEQLKTVKRALSNNLTFEQALTLSGLTKEKYDELFIKYFGGE